MKTWGTAEAGDASGGERSGERGPTTSPATVPGYLLRHGSDPPVLGLGGGRVGRRRHLHLTGVAGETVRAAVETRQQVLEDRRGRDGRSIRLTVGRSRKILLGPTESFPLFHSSQVTVLLQL